MPDNSTATFKGSTTQVDRFATGADGEIEHTQQLIGSPTPTAATNGEGWHTAAAFELAGIHRELRSLHALMLDTSIALTKAAAALELLSKHRQNGENGSKPTAS